MSRRSRRRKTLLSHDANEQLTNNRSWHHSNNQNSYQHLIVEKECEHWSELQSTVGESTGKVLTALHAVYIDPNRTTIFRRRTKVRHVLKWVDFNSIWSTNTLHANGKVFLRLFQIGPIYPVSQKKTVRYILAHNFGKCWPIFKAHSEVTV